MSCGSEGKPAAAGAHAASTAIVLRVGEVVNENLLTDLKIQDPASALIQSVSPELPAGLSLDFISGELTGIPAKVLADTLFEIAIDHSSAAQHYQLHLTVNSALPPAIETLQSGFSAELLVADASIPVRMAAADDGRLFYAELLTGNIRVVVPHTGLLEEPFASVPVVSGMEKGLIGLALDPDFSINGYLYVNATVHGHVGLPDHAEIIRFTAQGNRGVSPVVLVDNLPVADLHNGGDIVFDRDGNFFIGRGDINTPLESQLDGGLSGKVLRYTRDGLIPDDNPIPDDPEWCRGLRNTFAMALNPRTGDLFGADAGPTSDDKLNYLQAGKNFTWGMQEEAQGSGIGYSLRVWNEVITPTGILFSDGLGRFTDIANELLIASYNFGDIRVLHLDGEADTDVIREETFAKFKMDGINNKPLHLAQDGSGGLYVSTFDAIYRIF